MIAFARRVGHDERMSRAQRSVPARIVLAVAGVVQVTFASLAFSDLARRSAKEIKGPKLVWVPVILVNWIGPAVYFLFSRRR